MDELQILYDFLVSLLPAALIAKALGFAGVTTALVRLLTRIPWVQIRRKWAAPLLALILGQVGGWLSIGWDTSQWLLAVGAGLVITLTAVGGFESARNLAQMGSTASRSKSAA